MKFETLFQALVIGGSMIGGGCASKTVPPVDAKVTVNTEQKQPETQENNEKLDCKSLCESPNLGRESICPDPGQDGVSNCCWLMAQQHPCCGETSL